VATGIFGGTFDPVHIGHLRTAVELREFLRLDRMLLIPCGDPPHRETPMTPANQRLAMVELAIRGEPGLVVDNREIARPGFSYSMDTLEQLRAELGNDEPLCFCMGMDSLIHFATWHRWREFLQVCHLVVVARPGWAMPTQGEVAEWASGHRVFDAAELLTKPAGYIFVDEMTLLPVAATALRDKLKKNESIRYLTPDAVIDYIHSHRLYVQS